MLSVGFKVVWVKGAIRQDIPGMYDKPKPLCLWWIKQHKQDAEFNGGKLIVEPLAKCPNCGKPWDKIECSNCGFDAYCFDPNWD